MRTAFQPLTSALQQLATDVGPLIGPVIDAFRNLGVALLDSFSDGSGAIALLAAAVPYLSAALQVALPFLADLVNFVADNVDVFLVVAGLKIFRSASSRFAEMA